MHFPLTILALLLGAGALPVAAQLPSPITAGNLARLDIGCPAEARGARCTRLVGRVEAVGPDSLTLRLADDGSRRIAWANVQGLAISHRSRGHAGQGFLAGTAIGVLAGALEKSSCLQTAGEYGGLCSLSYLLTVPAGALLGTVIGALLRTPTWEVVPVPGSGGRRATRPAVRFGLALRLPI